MMCEHLDFDTVYKKQTNGQTDWMVVCTGCGSVVDITIADGTANVVSDNKQLQQIFIDKIQKANERYELGDPRS